MTRRRDRQTGTALVELALVLPVLAMLTLGVVDLGRVYRLENHLKNAAREGANYGQNDPLSQKPDSVTCFDPNDIQYHVYAEAGTTNVTVTITPTETGDCQAYPGSPAIPVGCPIKVSVGQKFTPITPMLGALIGSPVVHGVVTVKTQGAGPGGVCPST